MKTCGKYFQILVHVLKSKLKEEIDFTQKSHLILIFDIKVILTLFTLSHKYFECKLWAWYGIEGEKICWGNDIYKELCLDLDLETFVSLKYNLPMSTLSVFVIKVWPDEALDYDFTFESVSKTFLHTICMYEPGRDKGMKNSSRFAVTQN